jgi:hypothetical protein
MKSDIRNLIPVVCGRANQAVNEYIYIYIFLILLAPPISHRVYYVSSLYDTRLSGVVPFSHACLLAESL